MKQLCRFLRFIALQVADQAPLSVSEFTERRVFFSELLHPVFTEHADAGTIGLLDLLRFHGLADSHQRDGVRAATDSGGGARNALADLSNIVSDGHARIIGGRRTKTSPRMNTR